MTGVSFCLALMAAATKVEVSSKVGEWSMLDERPSTEEDIVLYIAEEIVNKFLPVIDDSALDAVKSVVLNTIKSFPSNFNCEDRYEIFTNPKDCVEKK